MGKMGDLAINTQILRARLSDAGLLRAAVLAVPFFLVAPALWNGYPLLQWDTGGYLARWYEGYLVPSRSTVFGLYLHLGEGSDFWLDLAAQALATLWILQLTLRVLSLSQPFRLLAISLSLVLTTALPWLASMLLTDIFAGLSVLSLFGLCCLGWIARPFLRKTIAASGLLQGSLTIVAGALMLLATNFAFSGQLA